MDIHWFPGHMAKATRMVEDNIKLVDAVIYVLDARCPSASINTNFNSIIGNRPIVYALNKADTVPNFELNEWIKRLTSENTSAVALDSTKSGSAFKIIPLVIKHLEEKMKRQKSRGINYTARSMVVGVPNTGKSTLINNLCGKSKTLTGNQPGITKGKQWLRVNDYFEILDTPGILMPKLTDQRLAYQLAFCGSVKDDVLDITEVSCKLLEELLVICPDLVKVRYHTSDLTLEGIARSRGFLLRGGSVDTERAALAVLDDFRKGRIGKIILEKAEL